MSTFSATYSPEDNKLRLYASSRLSAEEYTRVKSAGFSWAPKQELFVAPAWSPEREDLLISFAGEIGDEDTSLVERAEERAERFEDYHEARTDDAESARRAVSAIADNIPFGQPILVGHHSERHARKDAERIENGMRRAVKMWETAQYWKARASGAVRAAKYKERPDVRARRIKGLEADARKLAKQTADAERYLRLWAKDPATLKKDDGSAPTAREWAMYIANRDYVSQCFPLADFPRDPPASQYEGEMSLWSALEGNVITPEQAKAIALRVHERGQAIRARWAAHIANRLEYELAMLAESGGTVAERTGPEKGGACMCWASPRGGWSYIQKVNKVSVSVLDNWGNGGGNFTRTIPFDKIAKIMTAAQVQAARDDGTLHEVDETGFVLRDAPLPERTKTEEPAQAAAFDSLKEQLRKGVKVVSAPQLFATPPDVAARMVGLADIAPTHRILEPSAGTGNLLRALPPLASVVAVEINHSLADALRSRFPADVHCCDFLQCNGEIGTFDRILMNPPFANGDDIKHIKHAMQHLNEGGILVAICADGPRQRDTLQPLADSWEALPAGTFKDAGTMVNAALVTIRK